MVKAVEKEAEEIRRGARKSKETELRDGER